MKHQLMRFFFHCYLDSEKTIDIEQLWEISYLFISDIARVLEIVKKKQQKRNPKEKKQKIKEVIENPEEIQEGSEMIRYVLDIFRKMIIFTLKNGTFLQMINSLNKTYTQSINNLELLYSVQKYGVYLNFLKIIVRIYKSNKNYENIQINENIAMWI